MYNAAAPAPLTAADDSSERPGTSGAHGQTTPKFDYTHVGPKGAELIAAMIAEDPVNAVPEIGGLIVP